MRRSARVTMLSLLVVLALLTFGCTFSDPDGSNMTAQEQFNELMKRPDVDQAKQRYDAMQAKIRTTLSNQLNLPEWEEDPKTGGDRPCGDFPDVHSFDTLTFTRPLWSTKGSLNDSQWSRATKIVRQIGTEYGFTQVSLESRNDEIATLEITDGQDASITLMDNPQDLLVLHVDAGCHLQPEAKKRGRPINEQEKESYRRKPDTALPSAPAASEPAANSRPTGSNHRDIAAGTADQPDVVPRSSSRPPTTSPPRHRQQADDEDDYDDMNFLR